MNNNLILLQWMIVIPLSWAMTQNSNSNIATISELYRYAVKGFTGDSLQSVFFCNNNNKGETFPDDRRFALLYENNLDKFNPNNPSWLHKENFLCAFTAPKLFAQYRAVYQKQIIIYKMTKRNNNNNIIINNKWSSMAHPCDQIITALVDDDDDENNNDDNNNGATTTVQRLFTLYNRNNNNDDDDDEKNRIAIGPLDLETISGRQALGEYMSLKSGKKVHCVCSNNNNNNNVIENNGSNNNNNNINVDNWMKDLHKHQFGNTSSGWKLQQPPDTRTVHIVNTATIEALSKAIQHPLYTTRFRPNIVLTNLPAWKEFEWIGKTITIQNNNNNDTGRLQYKILSKTVRCNGISIDPYHNNDNDSELDIPKLLTQHFPEHGPYLGVYATLINGEEGSTISIGDTLIAEE